MEALLDVLSSIADIIVGFLSFIMMFVSDLFSMIVTLVKLPAVLGTVLGWTNSVGILPYITCIIGLAIVYKILGRE